MDVPIDQKVIQKWLTDIWTSTDETSCEKAMKELAIVPLKNVTECQPENNDTVIDDTVVKSSCEPIDEEPVIDVKVNLSQESLQCKNRLLRQHKNALEASRTDSDETSFRFRYENKLLSPRNDRVSFNNDSMTGPDYIRPTPPKRSVALDKMWEEENEKVIKKDLKLGTMRRIAMNRIVTRDCDFCRSKNHSLQDCTRYIPVEKVFLPTQIIKTKGWKYCFLCQRVDHHYAPTCDFFVWVSRPSYEQVFAPRPASSA